jgi:hypothetical protein
MELQPGTSSPLLQGAPSRVESGRLGDLRAASGRPPCSRRDSGPLSPGRSPSGSRGEGLPLLQGLARVESGRPGSALRLGSAGGSAGPPGPAQLEAAEPAAADRRILMSPTAAQACTSVTLLFISCVNAVLATVLQQCQGLLLGEYTSRSKVTLEWPMQVAAAAEAAGAVVAQHRRQLAAGLVGAQRHATPTPDEREATASLAQLVSRALMIATIDIEVKLANAQRIWTLFMARCGMFNSKG